MSHAPVTKYFDDVAVGDDIPQLVKGPLTLIHLVRWSAATENWHRIHYDRAYARDHDGLPDVLVNGSLKQQFVAQMLKDWAGLEGWVWKVAIQFRAMDVVGTTLRVWGRVAGKRACPGYGLVRVRLGIAGADETESTRGQALVALPYLGGPPVPYPFVPPAPELWQGEW